MKRIAKVPCRCGGLSANSGETNTAMADRIGPCCRFGITQVITFTGAQGFADRAISVTTAAGGVRRLKTRNFIRWKPCSFSTPCFALVLLCVRVFGPRVPRQHRGSRQSVTIRKVRAARRSAPTCDDSAVGRPSGGLRCERSRLAAGRRRNIAGKSPHLLSSPSEYPETAVVSRRPDIRYNEVTVEARSVTREW